MPLLMTTGMMTLGLFLHGWSEATAAAAAVTATTADSILRAPCTHHVVHLSFTAFFECICGPVPKGRDAWKSQPFHLLEVLWMAHRLLYGSRNNDKQPGNRLLGPADR